jgi:hypothetical protein
MGTWPGLFLRSFVLAHTVNEFIIVLESSTIPLIGQTLNPELIKRGVNLNASYEIRTGVAKIDILNGRRLIENRQRTQKQPGTHRKQCSSNLPPHSNLHPDNKLQ